MPDRHADADQGAQPTSTLILHVRTRSRRTPSVVVHGPFDSQVEAADFTRRLHRWAKHDDRIELLPHPGHPFPATPAARAEAARALAARLLGRLETTPGNFEPQAANTTKTPAALFALACIEAPEAAATAAHLIDREIAPHHWPPAALTGQLLLDVPHETAEHLHAIRWPARWSPDARHVRPDSRPRPANAATACAVLAWRLHRNRWPLAHEAAGLRRRRGR